MLEVESEFFSEVKLIFRRDCLLSRMIIFNSANRYSIQRVLDLFRFIMQRLFFYSTCLTFFLFIIIINEH